jgi:1,4-dihydroxy-2-naphthoate polyprenyltransferase
MIYDDDRSDYLRSMNPWIQAARLRTLPLALSGILLGGTLSHICGVQNSESRTNQPHLFWWVMILALLTATGLQILSNFANDYGDFKKGTDTKANRTDRAMASGKINENQMKKVLWILGVITLILGVSLITISGLFESKNGIFMLLTGLVAIAAAINYTMGKRAYGYSGFGDVFVLIFFGLVPVLGMGVLNGLFTDTASSKNFDVFVMAALGLGFLSVAVLNVNNYRDIHTDSAQNKKTIAVRLGAKKTLLYHRILLLLGGSLVPASFWVFEKRYFEWPSMMGAQTFFLIGVFTPVFLQLSSHYQAVKNSEPGQREILNQQLKKLSISILVLVLIYAFLAYFVIDFLGPDKD